MLEKLNIVCKNCTEWRRIKLLHEGVLNTMGIIVTINKVMKQMGVLYIDLYREIVKMFKKNTKRVVRSICLGVGAFALCVVLAGAVFLAMGAFNKYIFTVDNWSQYPSDRITMIKSLESQYEFIGMNERDVENVLGKPSYVTKKEECEYIDLANIDYEYVTQYELNKKSKSITDMIDKNYVIAYKQGKVVYANVQIAD